MEVEALLGPMREERFALLVNLCRKITDYGTEKEQVHQGTYLTLSLDSKLRADV